MYVRTDEEVSGFRYLHDLSGATGIQGPAGPQGVQGEQGIPGPKGDPGVAYVEELNDVDLNNLQNGQVLKYNSTTQNWENANESGGGGGHTIKDNTDTALTQRNVLQFSGDLEASDDDANEKTVVAPHELTSAEMAEIMSTLPGTPTDLPVLFDERGTEYVVGYYVDSNGLKKPVYRNTISYTEVNATAGENTLTSVASLNIEHLISATLLHHKNETGKIYCVFYPFNISIVDNNLKCYVVSQNERSDTAILTYTKTTDTPA
jgi:hypothetical protein